MKGTCAPSRQGESILEKGCTPSQPNKKVLQFFEQVASNGIMH